MPQATFANQSHPDPEPRPRPKGHINVYDDKFVWQEGINLDLPPLSRISTIFGAITDLGLKNDLQSLLSLLNNRPLRIGTMCSGTEAPILGLNMVTQRKFATPLNPTQVFPPGTF